MTGHIAAWAYFVLAWVFILGVLLKRWRERERRDQAATEAELKRTRPHVGNDRIWDA